MNVIEELGDIEFALEAIRKALSINREEVLTMNADKLMARYPNGKFSNADAQARADKESGQIKIELQTEDKGGD
jgi:uncharacterized protein YabN with tetrapyrrole methylase and pyrophosphatase domain